MASKRQTTANRANATKSTRPRTEGGKALAKMNAVAHGLRSISAVVPGETADEWEAFRAGVVAALAPVGTLEAELADRIALLSWRLRRVAAYEAGVTASAVVRAVAKARADDLGDAADDWAEALGRPRAYSTRSYATVRVE